MEILHFVGLSLTPWPPPPKNKSSCNLSCRSQCHINIAPTDCAVYYNAGIVVLTDMAKKSITFWDVMPEKDRNSQMFGRNILPPSSRLKNEPGGSQAMIPNLLLSVYLLGSLLNTEDGVRFFVSYLITLSV
jgi:hypothetical protein